MNPVPVAVPLPDIYYWGALLAASVLGAIASSVFWRGFKGGI